MLTILFFREIWWRWVCFWSPSSHYWRFFWLAMFCHNFPPCRLVSFHGPTGAVLDCLPQKAFWLIWNWPYRSWYSHWWCTSKRYLGNPPDIHLGNFYWWSWGLYLRKLFLANCPSFWRFFAVSFRCSSLFCWMVFCLYFTFNFKYKHHLSQLSNSILEYSKLSKKDR